MAPCSLCRLLFIRKGNKITIESLISSDCVQLKPRSPNCPHFGAMPGLNPCRQPHIRMKGVNSMRNPGFFSLPKLIRIIFCFRGVDLSELNADVIHLPVGKMLFQMRKEDAFLKPYMALECSGKIFQKAAVF